MVEPIRSISAQARQRGIKLPMELVRAAAVARTSGKYDGFATMAHILLEPDWRVSPVAEPLHSGSQPGTRGLVSPIRIHLGPMPEMLRSIVDGLLAEEPDLVVVGRSARGEDALLQARAEQAEMLITAEGEHADSRCLGAILSGPPLSILAIARNGRDGTAVSLAGRQIDLDRSGGALSEAIRCAVAAR